MNPLARSFPTWRTFRRLLNLHPLHGFEFTWRVRICYILRMIKIIAALLLACSVSQAVTFKVVGPCDSKPLYATQAPVDLTKSAGQISRDLFNAQGIPFAEGTGGFESILGTPKANEATEVISKNVIRAYGWCYQVNGKIPDVMADDLALTSQNDEVIWYFASTTLEKGEWKNFCEPSYLSKPARFCGGDRH